MKSRKILPYIVAGVLSMFFASQSFGMSSSEAAYFKRTCIKAGGHIGTRDGEYVCAGVSIKAPTGKKTIKQKGKIKTNKKVMKSKVKKPKEEAY